MKIIGIVLILICLQCGHALKFTVNDHNKNIVCYMPPKIDKKIQTVNSVCPQLTQLCTHIVYGRVEFTYFPKSFDFRLLYSMQPLPKFDIKKMKNGNKLKVILGIRPPAIQFGYVILDKLPNPIKWVKFLKQFGFDGLFIEYIGDLSYHHNYMTRFLNHLYDDFKNANLLLMTEDKTCSEYPFDSPYTELKADLLISSCKNIFGSYQIQMIDNNEDYSYQSVIEQPEFTSISGFPTSKVIGSIDFIGTNTTIDRVVLKSIYNRECDENVLRNLRTGILKGMKIKKSFKTLYGKELFECYDEKTIMAKITSSISNGLGGIFVTLDNGPNILSKQDKILLEAINTGIFFAFKKVTISQSNQIIDNNIIGTKEFTCNKAGIDMEVNNSNNGNSINTNGDLIRMDYKIVGKILFREVLMMIATILYFSLTM